MSTAQRAAVLALGIVVLTGLTGCSGGGSGDTATTAAQPEMSQSERKATIPDLEKEATTVAEGMVDAMADGGTETGSEYVAAHPLADHHHLGKWEIGKPDATGASIGTVCIEYRPTKDADPVAMATANAQYAPASGSVRELRRASPVGNGLNVGC